MTIHTVVNSVSFRVASLQRKKNLLPKENAVRQKTGFSNVKVLVKWWTAENGIYELEH